MSDSRQYLTVTDIAAKAARSERTVWRWRKRDDFPAPVLVPHAGRILFDPKDVELYLRRKRRADA